MQRAKLPPGWVRVPLGEICLPVATLWPSDKPDDNFTYFDIGGIDNQQNRIAETKTMLGRNAPSRARQAVKKGDILFSTVRTYLRNIARIENTPPNPVASTGFSVIRVGPGVADKLVFQQLLSERFLQPLHALQTGSSYPAVRDRDVFAQPIVLPPGAEQDRIVEKLDAILPHISAGEVAAQRALVRLNTYRAAVLHAAVTGKLTSAWREAQPKPDESGVAFLRRLLDARRAQWEEAELDRLKKLGKPPKDEKWKNRYSEPTQPDIAELPRLARGWVWASVEQINPGDRVCAYGVLQPGPHRENGIPLVRVGDIKDGKISLGEMKRVSPSAVEGYRRTKLKGGELLITLVGAIGRTAVVPMSLAGANTARAVGVVPITQLVNPAWVELSFRSPLKLTEMIGKAHEVARKTLNLEDVRRAVVPLPPRAEQDEIVRQVERRLTHADRLTASLETGLARARAWRQSVLNAAFAGQLIPQNADDEPASVLVEKIRAAREILTNQPKPKRGRAGRKKTMKAERRKLLDVLKEAKAPMKPEDLFATAGFNDSTVEEYFSELKDLVAKKKVREKRDPQDRGFVRLEVRG